MWYNRTNSPDYTMRGVENTTLLGRSRIGSIRDASLTPHLPHAAAMVRWSAKEFAA
jgi:hypothetical protein